MAVYDASASSEKRWAIIRYSVVRICDRRFPPGAANQTCMALSLAMFGKSQYKAVSAYAGGSSKKIHTINRRLRTLFVRRSEMCCLHSRK
jgi:hypothetical protein